MYAQVRLPYNSEAFVGTKSSATWVVMQLIQAVLLALGQQSGNVSTTIDYSELVTNYAGWSEVKLQSNKT